MNQVKTLYTKEKTLILKGIAILLMVFHHSFRAERFFEKFDVEFGFFSIDSVISFSIMCKVCVSLFVFISGYGLYLGLTHVRTQDYSKWIYNRLLKLLANFAFVYSLCFCLILVFHPDEILTTFFSEGKEKGIVSIFCNITGLQNFFGTPNLNGAWWYMSAAIFFIVAAPVVKKFIDSYGTVVAIGIVTTVPRIFIKELADENHIYKFVMMYVLGMIFAKKDWLNKILTYASSDTSIRKIGRCMLEIAGCVVSYKLAVVLSDEVYWEIKYAVFPLFIILVTIEFIAAIPVVSTILQWIGKYSMNIYFVHNYARIYGGKWIYDNHFFLLASLLMLGFGFVGAICIELLKKIFHYNQVVDKFYMK